MIKKKIIFMIPGFGESTKDQAYSTISKELKLLRYQIVPHQPQWKNNTIKKWLVDFQKILKQYDSKPAILGFSFGAYIALLAAQNFKFSKMILCSLSPYFKEDIKHLPPIAHKMLGKKRIQDFSNYAFPKDLKIPAVFLVGDQDMELVVKRSIISHRQYRGAKKFILVKGAEHDLNNKNYIASIKKALSS